MLSFNLDRFSRFEKNKNFEKNENNFEKNNFEKIKNNFENFLNPDPVSSEKFSFFGYFGFLFFSPLYAAGPIINYSSWYLQISENGKSTLETSVLLSSFPPETSVFFRLKKINKIQPLLRRQTNFQFFIFGNIFTFYFCKFNFVENF
jgi:hypothetical protein